MTNKFLIDQLEKPRQLCIHYYKHGLCGSGDAPKPGHSRCIGTKTCGVWEKSNKTEA